MFGPLVFYLFGPLGSVYWTSSMKTFMNLHLQFYTRKQNKKTWTEILKALLSKFCLHGKCFIGEPEKIFCEQKKRNETCRGG